MTNKDEKFFRSKLMSHVKRQNTKPEILIRKLIFSMGYRYRLHIKELPGTPDIVFKKRRKVIFVNGCYWHGHRNCKKATIPKTNTDFWLNKIKDNRNRDRRNIVMLNELGWDVLTVWECEMKDIKKLSEKIENYLF